MSEPSTDESTVDLDSVIEQDHTTHHGFEPSTGRRGRTGLPVEANVILIAHPDETMLGTRYRLPPQAVLEIGRSSATDISMPGVQSLSRRHARLNHLGRAVEIEDLGSTNGTYVNDAQISASKPLASGDRFQLGAAHFKFLHEQDPEHAYHEAIYQLVMRDGLTQIYNKRKFHEELEREVLRAVRHRRPLSLILFDIDHFKEVNDSYGHLCGDFVLQQIARQAGGYLRPEQVFARAGGEEFVILSPEIDQAGALKLAEQLRLRVASETYSYLEFEVHITCSFGVAVLLPEMDSGEDLYEAADRAMYQSKNDGRNRVSRYQPAS